MSNVINLRINVSKIDKKRLYQGEKGLYLDVALIPTPNNEYQDYMAVESVTKEEREKGKQGTILGGAKVFKPKVDAESLPPSNDEPPAAPAATDPDDLPF